MEKNDMDILKEAINLSQIQEDIQELVRDWEKPIRMQLLEQFDKEFGQKISARTENNDPLQHSLGTNLPVSENATSSLHQTDRCVHFEQPRYSGLNTKEAANDRNVNNNRPYTQNQYFLKVNTTMYSDEGLLSMSPSYPQRTEANSSLSCHFHLHGGTVENEQDDVASMGAALEERADSILKQFHWDVVRTIRRSGYEDGDDIVLLQPVGMADSPTLLAKRNHHGFVSVCCKSDSNQKALFHLDNAGHTQSVPSMSLKISENVDLSLPSPKQLTMQLFSAAMSTPNRIARRKLHKSKARRSLKFHTSDDVNSIESIKIPKIKKNSVTRVYPVPAKIKSKSSAKSKGKDLMSTHNGYDPFENPEQSSGKSSAVNHDEIDLGLHENNFDDEINALAFEIFRHSA